MGPYTLEQINEYLAQGFLSATDYAWHEGLPEWVPLNEIAGVTSNQAVTSVPPPFNPTATAPAGKGGSKKKLFLFGGIGVGVAALIAVVLVIQKDAKAKPLIADPIVEKKIRAYIKKPTGKLTKADLEKVTLLVISDKQLTSCKGLENLTQLKEVHLGGNQLTDVKGLENLTQLETAAP